MDATEAARAALEATKGWFPYRIEPTAVRIEEFALAGVARCRRLLQGMVDLHDQSDLAGTHARSLYEAWLSTMYLVLDPETAFERLEANDRTLIFQLSK